MKIHYIPQDPRVHASAVGRGWGRCAAVGGLSCVICPHTGSGCWWRRSITPLCPLETLLWSCQVKGQASHAPLSSISPFSLWHSLPPLTLICIPRMPTQSGSQPGTLGACRQRHALLNKSSSVVPEHDECGMSSTNPVRPPRIGATVWRWRAHTYCNGWNVCDHILLHPV